MDDKVKKIYELYVSKKLINPENVDYETFSNADEKQLGALYKLGSDNNLFNSTDQETFNSAFLKKKDFSEESETPSGEKLDGEDSTSELENGELDSQESQDDLNPGGEETETEEVEEEDLTITPEESQPSYTLQGQTVPKETLEEFSQDPDFHKLDWQVDNDDEFSQELVDIHNNQKESKKTEEPTAPPVEDERKNYDEHTYNKFEEPYNSSPQERDNWVSLKDKYPELKLSYDTHDEYDAHQVPPKTSHFLDELKEIYPDWNNLDISSAFRDHDHHHFYEAERNGNKPTSNVNSRHKHGLAVDFKGSEGKKLMEFLLNDPKGKALAEKWGEGGNLKNGIHDEYIDAYAKKHDRNHLHFSITREPITVRSEKKKIDTESTNERDVVNNANFLESATKQINPNLQTNPLEYEQSTDNKVKDLISKLNSNEEATFIPGAGMGDSGAVSNKKVYPKEFDEKIKELKKEISKTKNRLNNLTLADTSVLHGNPNLDDNLRSSIDKLENELKTTIEQAESQSITNSQKIGVTPQEIETAYKNNKKFNYLNDPAHKIPEYIKEDKYFQDIYSKRQDYPFLGKDLNKKMTDIWLDNYLAENEGAKKENKIHSVNLEFLKTQLDKGFSYIGNDQWLHLETGVVLSNTQEHNANPLIADKGARVDILETLVKDPDYINKLDSTEVDRLYKQYHPKKYKEYKSKIKYYESEYKEGEDDDLFSLRGGSDLTYEQMVDVSKGDFVEAKYNFLMPILGDLTAGTFNQYSETSIGKDAENLHESIDAINSWVTNQSSLMQTKYPTRLNSSGVLEIDGSKMSNDEIKKANKDANDLKRMLEIGNSKQEKLEKIQSSSFIKLTKDLNDMYDEVHKQGTSHMSKFELREKIINDQIDRQIKADEKFSKKNWLGKFWWNTRTVIDQTTTNLAGGILQMPQFIDETLDEWNEGTGTDTFDEFSWVDDLAENGSNAYGENSFMQTLTKHNTGWKYQTAKVNGINLIIKDGKVLNMYDDNYIMIDPRSIQAGLASQKYLKNPEDFPTELQTNSGAYWMSGLQSFADLAVDVLIAKRLGSMGTTAKMKKGIHLGTMYTNYVARTYQGYIDQYLSDVPDATMEEAQDYARTTSSIVGLTQFISPNFGFGLKTPFAFGTKANRNFALGNMTRAQMFRANMAYNWKHFLKEGGKEGVQELAELEAQRITNNLFYNSDRLNKDRSEMKYEYYQNGSLGFIVGLGGNIRNIRNPFNFNVDRFQQESLLFSYLNQDAFNKSLDDVVGQKIYHDGEVKTMTQERAEEIKQESKDIFQTVENAKQDAKKNGVNLDESAEFALLNLTKNKKEIQGYQNSKDSKTRDAVRERLQVIENHTQRILKGEDAYKVLNEHTDKEFEDLGLKANDLTPGQKTVYRKLKNKRGFTNDEKKWSIRGLSKAIKELDSKSELTPEEQQKKDVLQELLNQVNNVNPTTNEKSDKNAEHTGTKIDGLTNMDESQTEKSSKESEVQSVTTPEGKAGRRINPLSPNAKISDAIGKNVEYKGRKGILTRDKNGNFVIKTPGRGRNVVVKEAKRPNMQLKTAGITTTGTPFTITGDGTISMQGQPNTKVVAINKDENGNVESLIVTDPEIGNETGKVMNQTQINRAKKQIQKLQEKLRNNEITKEQYNEAIAGIKGVRTVSFPDVQLDVAAEQLVNEILQMNPDFSTVTMQDFDNMIEEEMSKEEALMETENVTKEQQKKREKAITDALNEKGTRYTNNKDDINDLKKKSGAYLSLSNNPFANLKGRILRQAYKIFIPLGHDVVVHNNSNSLYNELRKTINPDTGNIYTHSEANQKKNSKGFILGANGDIHVNLSTAQDNTLFHEGAHPFIKSLLKRMKKEGGKGPLTDFFNNVEGELNKKERPNGRGTYMDYGMLYAIKDSDGNILNKDKVIEEALAEYLGDAGAQEFNKKYNLDSVGFDESFSNKAKNFLNKILNFFGLKSNKPFELNYEGIVDLGGITKAYTTTIPKGKKLNIDKAYRAEGGVEFQTVEDLNNAEPGAVVAEDITIPDINNKVGENIVPKKPKNVKRTFKENDVVRLDRGDFKGQTFTVIAADRALTGNVKSPTGVEMEFKGGMYFPYAFKGYAWAVEGPAIGTRLINSAKKTDGRVAVMITGERGIEGSLLMSEYIIKEFQNVIDNKIASKKSVLEFINGKLNNKAIREAIDKKNLLGNRKGIKDLNEIIPMFEQLSFGARKSFIEKIVEAKDSTLGKFGLPGSDAILDWVNDPDTKGIRRASVVSMIQIDVNNPDGAIVDTKAPDYNGPIHQSYRYLVKGSPITILNKSIPIEELSDDYKGEQYMLGGEFDANRAGYAVAKQMPTVEFQLDESNYSNTLDAIENSTINKGNPSQWIKALNNVASNPTNLKIDMNYLGLKDFLQNVKNSYPNQMIPKKVLEDWVDINKAKIERVSNNEISISNPFYKLANVKFKEVRDDDGNKTLLINDILANDNVMLPNIEPVIRRVLRYASDTNYDNISFVDGNSIGGKKGQFFNEVIPEAITDVVKGIDSSAGPVLNDIDGVPLTSIQITPQISRKSTMVNSPSFQMDDSSIPLSDQFILRLGNMNVHTDIISRYLTSERGLPGMLEKQIEMQGKIKSIKLEMNTIHKKMKRLIENQKDFTLEELNDALQDPTKKIKELQRKINFLENDKSRFNKNTKKYKGIESKIDAKILDLVEQIKEIESEYGGKTRLKSVESVNPELHQTLVDARNLVDKLSQELSGYVQGDMKTTIDKNLGLYIMKQYKAHHEPKMSRRLRRQYEGGRVKRFLRDKLGGRFGTQNKTVEELLNEQGVLGKAINYIYQDMVDNKKEGDPPIDSDAIINALNNLLGNHKTNFINRIVATNTVRDHVLERRKDIPDPIYQLLNEVKSPLFNFQQTVSQMASTLETKKYQQRMVDMFLNTKVLKKGITVRGGKDIVSPDTKLQEKIVIGDEVYFTDKFTKAQILGHEQYAGVFARTYMKFLAAVKMGKTVYSPATHARNFTSNFGFAVMNGHINPGYMYESMFLAGQIFNESSVEERRVLFRKMVELGVIDDVADLSELRDMLRAGGSEAFGSTDIEPGDIDEKTILEKVGNVPKKTLKKIHKGVLNMYLFEDAYWKTVGFLHEMNRYEKAGLSKEDAMNEAGNIVRNAYPTYSMTPELVKKLRINPLVGTFVSYPAEVIRTQIMTIKQAKKELASSNNKIREIGVKRMVGIAAWHIGFPVAATALFKGLALGLGMLSKGLSDEEEKQLSFFDSELMEDRDLAALIRFVGADWNKNSQIIPMMETEPGVYYFWSVSDNNSHGYFTEIVNSIFERQEDDPFWGNDDWAILFNDPTFIAVTEPFLGEDILAKNIREIAEGEKDNGAPLYEKQDTRQEKFIKAMNHLWDGVKPSVINNAERLIKSYQPSKEDGSKYVPEFEWLALGGIRLSKIDLAESYKYKMMAVNNYINDFTVKKEDGTYEFKTNDAKEKILRMLEFADNYSEAIHDLGIERMTVMDEEKGIPDSNYGGNPEKSNYIKYIILKNIYAKPGLREILLRDKSETYGFPDVEDVLEWSLKDKQVEALKNQVEQD